jgi:hypothetical protein
MKTDDIQFGFTPGKIATDAIFTVGQVQEQFRDKNKNKHIVPILKGCFV